MRVLVTHPGPHFSVADVYTGVVKGLRQNGCEVVDFNLDDRLDFYVAAELKKEGEYRKAFHYEAACMLTAKGLQGAIYEFWPDVIILMSGFYLPPYLYDLIRARGHHLVLWCTESPYEDNRQLKQAARADTVVLNDPTNIDEFRAINPRTVYVPHAYDPDIHKPGHVDPDLQCDFSFVGTGYPSRTEFFEKVDWAGVHAYIAGNWQHVTDDSPLLPLLLHQRGWCIDNTDAVRLYNASKLSANLYRKEAEDDHVDEGWAMGPREVELAASETFFLREARAEGDLVLNMLPRFTCPGEFEELMRWWLAHDDLRVDTVRQAKAAVVDRTFKNHTAQLLKLI